MDERFRGRGIWVIAGIVGIVFVCLTLCGLGAMVTTFTRSEAVYIQPPVDEGGAVPPQVYQSPFGMGRSAGHGLFGLLASGIGLLFKMAFLGLLLLLLLGLVKRLLWGPRHWQPRHRGPHYGHQPPKGKTWRGQPHAWGPWAWHHGKPWEAEDEPADEEGEPEDPDLAYGGAE
jgi:hypothetical protein